ncbi:MAG TPA: hypothetical protein VFD32_15360 [Dehalococcoidia bacterium]|nr:hypothetical protein [Dehalococcoidia bacterium]
MGKLMSLTIAKPALLAGLGVGLALTLAAAGPAAAQTTPSQPTPAPASPLPWEARVQGMPQSFERGGTGGYYLWHDDSGFHLWTTDPEGIDSHYTGTLTTDGVFTTIVLEHPENDDHFTSDGAGTLSFNLHTASGIDGIDFDVQGGTRIDLALVRDGNQTSPDKIFLGEDSVHPNRNPFAVVRKANDGGGGGGGGGGNGWDNRIQGMPRSFEAGGHGGYYFWIDDQGFHLWTTDPENIDSHYTGTLTTDGSFGAVTLEKPEGDDSVSGQGGGTLAFDLHTHSGIDGLDFSVDGATKITLDLLRDGHRISVDNIFLGEDSVHPAHNPMDVHHH